MSIPYTYTIIIVDETARCMEVVYSAEGHQTIHVSARLPYEGETLEQVIHMYAPIAYWGERTAKVIVPAVGTSGSVQAITPDQNAIENQKMWEQIEFEKRVAAALVKFNVLSSDPTTIPVAQL